MSNSDKLFVGVLGNRNAGKSTTWNALFRRTVKTGKSAHRLDLTNSECVDAFIISGSPEERKVPIKTLLKNQKCRIVLCSIQYAPTVQDTLDYVFENDFNIYLQWLNSGYSDRGETWDKAGILNQVLAHKGVVAIRSGKYARRRVNEIREFIYGWASFRGLAYRP